MIMGKRPMDEKKVQKMKIDGYDGFYQQMVSLVLGPHYRMSSLTFALTASLQGKGISAPSMPALAQVVVALHYLEIFDMMIVIILHVY